MAALSSKAKAGRVIVVDCMVLPEQDARSVFKNLLTENLPSFKAPNKYKVPQALFRRDVYRYCNDPGLVGIVDQGMKLKQLFPDEEIVNNMMRKLDGVEGLSFAAFLARTGAPFFCVLTCPREKGFQFMLRAQMLWFICKSPSCIICVYGCRPCGQGELVE
jgi:hypothetical protein